MAMLFRGCCCAAATATALLRMRCYATAHALPLHCYHLGARGGGEWGHARHRARRVLMRAKRT
eukprot:4162487-Pyramimonas_sp.AAC.1